MSRIEEFVAFAERIAAGPYRYWTGNGRCDPIRSGYADCSGLVVAGLRHVGVSIECTGSFALSRACHAGGGGLSLGEARATRGALLFIGTHEGQGGIPGVDPGHVAISRGDGTTVEARNRRAGITLGPFDGRGWDYTAWPVWIPRVEVQPPPPPPPPPPPKEPELMLIYAPARQQTQGSQQPAFLHLDVEGRRVVGHNGARIKEANLTGDSFRYSLPAEPVGWCLAKNHDGTDSETILVALKGTSDKPLHLHFA